MSAALAPMTVVGGDYRIVRPLKAGGMGAVYVAEQLSTGKLRALKVMHAQLVEDPTQRERFVREARLAARVQSEHVVEVLAAGVAWDTGAPWLAMELLDGCDLSQLIKRQGALTLVQALPIMEQLCHGLCAAHDEGIVHRDLKPRNIFFSKLRSSTHPWTIKILDFGIAKLVADPALAATAALGSPAWMAPEQTETSTGIAPATDIWALALVLFWMLTGRSYWRSANHRDASVQTVLREMLFEPLDAPSERARAIAGAAPFPKQLDTWFARCVQRDPADRYAHARAAWEALCTQAAHQAPPSHVLPAQVASLAAEASAGEPATATTAMPDTEVMSSALETQPGSGADLGEVWASPQETREAAREVTREATRAGHTLASIEAGTAKASHKDADSIEAIDTRAGAAEAGDKEADSIEAIGTIASAAKITDTKADVIKASDTDAPLKTSTTRRNWIIAALALGAVSAIALMLQNDPPDTTSTRPSSNRNTTASPLPSVAPPISSSAPSTTRTTPEMPALMQAQQAFRRGQLREAERHAQALLDTLGGVAGRRPRAVAPTLDGAKAQRVLVQVALARATELPPQDDQEARSSLLDEAKIDCDKARTWSDEDDARCCHADIAAYLLAQLEPDTAPARTQLDRIKRQLDQIPSGARHCAAQLNRARKRMQQLSRPSRQDNAPSQPSVQPKPSAQPQRSEPRPFDAQRAKQVLNGQRARARAECSRLIGARSHTFELRWNPAGHLQVTGASSDPTSSCIERVLRASSIDRFEPSSAPPSQSITVTLDN